MTDVLYIVVLHPDDAQEWKNVWSNDDDRKLLSITTTPKVAKQCRDAEVIYVHRCGWRPPGGKYVEPLIAWVVKVAEITGLVVAFMDHEIVNLPAKKRLRGGTNSYLWPEP